MVSRMRSVNVCGLNKGCVWNNLKVTDYEKRHLKKPAGYSDRKILKLKTILYIYIYIYVCVCVCMHMCVICVCVCVVFSICVYIYIYTQIENSIYRWKIVFTQDETYSQIIVNYPICRSIHVQIQNNRCNNITQTTFKYLYFWYDFYLSVNMSQCVFI